ncbi:transcriptional regulator, DeoR family [Thermanaeromonas toyohensis ToBE]|uniref:Transcriptional regulator, DeoR family n=1 Tax=Thermanaeromonas toyohensis ToBE TaxID=698762 RepID=A0A1W1VXS1_9FIRM|nr:DeoR/GlpR family DNA-binding transcription regulator [Thermanaeromonas toyohensis]SMB98189.1 transcriptional regulator, DeoR family [Thermanaeromonas toyohensis ToBE]
MSINSLARREAILELLKESPYLRVEELARRLGVSEATVRRDLVVLSKEKKIDRIRGGASLASKLEEWEPSFTSRQGLNREEKKAIARLAMRLIKPGEAIALDVGTTTLALAEEIRKIPHLTVFTNGIPIAEALAGSSVSVYLLGGQLRDSEMSLVGALTRQAIETLRFDRFFLSAAGVTLKEGFSDFNLEEVEIKKAFISRAREVIALVDHTKLGRSSVVPIAPLQAAHLLITDEGAEQELITSWSKAGVRIELAPLGD